MSGYEDAKQIILQKRLSLDPFFGWLRERRVVVVFGPPGTGKTRAALKLFALGRLGKIKLRAHDPQRALYLAFNRSAAHDARRRLEELRVSNPKFREALGGIDVERRVRTLDSVAVESVGGAQRLLRVERRIVTKGDGAREIVLAPCSNCNADVEWSIKAAQRECARAYHIEYSLDEYSPARGNEIFQLYSFAVHVAGLREGVEMLDEVLEEDAQFAVRCYLKNYLGAPAFKYVDFAVANALALREGAPIKIVEKWGKREEVHSVETLIIDEFQDLSPLRLSWIPRLFPDAQAVVLAGDDDQTVYDSLHGADPGVLVAIHDMIKRGEINGDVVVLNESKRLHEPVAAVARRLIEKEPKRVPKDWRGKTVEGFTASVYVKPLAEGLRMIVENHRRHYGEFVQTGLSGFRQFVLTPTNAEIRDVVRELLEHGVLPMGLKGVPGVVKAGVEAALAACQKIKTEEDAKKFGAEDVRRARILATAEILRTDSLARGYASYRLAELLWRGAADCREFQALADLIDEVEKGKDTAWLTRYVTYVDTAYVAKGLEADTVFIINNTDSRAALQHIRAKYVALTRSRGNVYILEDKALGENRWIYELDSIARGVEAPAV